jgi:hypothetical protein
LSFARRSLEARRQSKNGMAINHNKAVEGSGITATHADSPCGPKPDPAMVVPSAEIEDAEARNQPLSD